MNPNEIKKVLECCIKDDCDNCLNAFGNCEHNLMSDALAYINQLEAEVEKYKATFEPMVNLMVEAKSDAVKEFAERLKKKYGQADILCPRRIVSLIEKDLDNLVKEMVGDEE